ncbi:hypothetical protein COLO4_03334 [Corchorus olitorius]|uniref:Uncharacterized protein n=1 Tax=Corchorus olitorius TaxID=93759 RepID=A0A1R3KYX3_9ROSI|nr:hypothetical protein COLO4_03334 [Corchorus olitorius]
MAPSKRQQQIVDRKLNNKLKVRMQRLKSEMGMIRIDQNRIREEQRNVRERFEQIQCQCDQLREETQLILKQTAGVQIRLILMFKIFRARKDGEFAKAAKFTRFLRELISRSQSKEKMHNVEA